MGTNQSFKVDPFTVEIVKDSLGAIGEEMFHALARTSMSPIIYEVLDYASGLTDKKGQLLTQGNGITAFVGMLSFMVKEVVHKFGYENIREGDIFIINDPYSGGGSHLSDVGLVLPIFHEGKLIAFSVNKAHWTEVGGKDPGSFTTDAISIFQEGLQFPCVKIFDQGKLNESIVEIIGANVRFPDLSIGDLWAQVAALKTGEKRFLEICDRYGSNMIEASINHLLDHTEKLSLKELAKLPEGEYEAVDYIDSDGIGNGPFRIQVKVTVSKDNFTCDFRGSHPQVEGPINCSKTGLTSAVRTLFLAVTNPSLDVNDGVFRPLEVIVDDDSVFNAKRPASVSMYVEAMMHAADLVWQAIAPVVPHRLPAGNQLGVNAVVLSGTNSYTEESFLWVEPSVGGWGASEGKDGEAGQFCLGNGETYNIPVEVLETRYGISIDEYILNTDGAGQGEHRGGSGVIRSFKVKGDTMYLTALFGRNKTKVWGMNEGKEGSSNRIEVIRANGQKEDIGVCARLPLYENDVVRMITATGGGYGNPNDRDPELVASDVKNNYISLKQAYEDYGVKVSPDNFRVIGLTEERNK